MTWLLEPQAWIALLTLTVLEIVLGIDNVVFISILAEKLPAHERARARTVGLAVALVTRIALLFSLTWLMRLTTPLVTLFSLAISGRDLILIIGGLFLLAKSTHEIHQKLEGEEGQASARVRASFLSVLLQILVLDVVFSLDSVITAVGMSNQIGIMVTAVIVAVGFMLVFAGLISTFINQHPTLKMLALSFLLLIGTTLIIEGLHGHMPKGYIYFAMAFSVLVEVLNLRMRRVPSAPVHFHEAYVAAPRDTGQPS